MPSMPLPSISSPQSQVNALMQMVQQALPTQSSIGSVMGMLNALSAQALPEPVMRAAKQLFENQLVAKDGKINAAALKTAIGISGIFQEAKLGQGKPEAATADTKSALLAMRQGLAQWLGDQTPIAQIKQPLPPLKHASPRAKLPELALEEMPADAEEFGRLLLDRTEGALARLRLHQHASLPDANKPGDQQWNLDLPLAYGSQQTVLSLQIEHDGGGDPSRTDDRGWQVRFAVNLKGLGEIGAQVSLRGQNAGVLLWAEEGATATQLSSAIDELRTDLERAGLTPGALVVRHGAPGDAMRPGSTGQFLDASR
ncbi:flagellar hook-length control protein FliK [Devosia soli]|nr:flagellar hook-length control protein FliK [Devosia soli]